MKGLIGIFVVLILSFKLNAQISNSSIDYAGKWALSIIGSPMGNVTFKTELTRKEGKLVGQLINKYDDNALARPITKIEESEKQLNIFFMSQQGDEISFDLNVVDKNSLKGLVMGYEVTASRID